MTDSLLHALNSFNFFQLQRNADTTNTDIAARIISNLQPTPPLQTQTLQLQQQDLAQQQQQQLQDEVEGQLLERQQSPGEDEAQRRRRLQQEEHELKVQEHLRNLFPQQSEQQQQHQQQQLDINCQPSPPKIIKQELQLSTNANTIINATSSDTANIVSRSVSVAAGQQQSASSVALSIKIADIKVETQPQQLEPSPHQNLLLPSANQLLDFEDAYSPQQQQQQQEAVSVSTGAATIATTDSGGDGGDSCSSSSSSSKDLQELLSSQSERPKLQRPQTLDLALNDLFNDTNMM